MKKKYAVMAIFLISTLFTGCADFLWPDRDEPDPICICCGYDCVKDCECKCRKCLNYKEEKNETSNINHHTTSIDNH